MQYRIHITDDALSDLQRIFEYIARDSPQNAGSFLERVLNAIDSLASMPRRFKRVGRSRRAKTPVHSLVIYPYLAYYRVEDSSESVILLTVRHGMRRQPRTFR